MKSQEQKLMKWCESHNIMEIPHKKRDHHFYSKKLKNQKRMY